MPANPQNISVPLHVVHINACILTCKAHDDGRPVRRCLHNGQTIQQNATAGVCPHPRADQFALQIKLEASGQRPSVFSWAVAGPLLWREFHRWTLTAAILPDGVRVDPAAAAQWIRAFIARILCGDCKEHATKYIADQPPDFSNREKLFEWGADFHNAVNIRLGKPSLPLDAARRIWSAAVVKPVIVTKGCGRCGK